MGPGAFVVDDEGDGSVRYLLWGEPCRGERGMQFSWDWLRTTRCFAAAQPMMQGGEPWPGVGLGRESGVAS